MDPRTGKIIEVEDDTPLSDSIPIAEEDMTPKQRKEKAVRLHDHRSKLGKKLTEARREAGLTKNRYRKLKRQGKLR